MGGMKRSSIRRWLGVPSRPDGPRIFFIHVPKTGGTSTIHALRQVYRDGFFKLHAGASLRAAKLKHRHAYRDFEQCYELRESLALYAMEVGHRCIVGHVPYSGTLFERPDCAYQLVTVLRDPVRRLLSKYRYNRHKPGDHCSVDQDLGSYLDSPAGRSSGTEYLRYFCGSPLGEVADVPLPELVSRAKANLDRVGLIGFLDTLDDFALKFRAMSGQRLRIPHKNRTLVPGSEPPIDPATYRKMEELCRIDIEIYQYARRLAGL